MLKPQRKIIRKEIKRDPFLETIDKIEYNFEQNRKTYLYIALGLIAVIISGNFLLNKQSQKDIDSNSALGIALVAFDNEDYENLLEFLDGIYPLLLSDKEKKEIKLLSIEYNKKLNKELNGTSKKIDYMTNNLKEWLKKWIQNN